MDTTDPWQTARQAADLVGDRLGEHDALIVLGSGWRDVVERVGERNGELAVDAFVARGDSPVRKPLLLVANEVTGSTVCYEVRRTGGLLSGLLNR